MAKSDDFILTNLDGGVLTVAFNRPDALNAFIPPMLVDFTNALRAAQDSGAKVVVIEGRGRAFSAGVDLKYLGEIKPKAGRIGGVFDGPAFEAATAIRDCPLPVIAKVHGFCFTGALEIALHCDMIYTMADAKFGDTHAKFGIRPTWGMTQTLPRAVGLRRAKELSYTSLTFTGAEALDWAMANAAYDSKEELDLGVTKVASAIVKNSSATVAAIKDLHALTAANMPLNEALDEEVRREYPNITDTLERLSGFIDKAS